MPSNIPYAPAALYGVLAALAILIGGHLVSPSRELVRGPMFAFASVGAGFLIGLGLLGALPEALAHASSPATPTLIAVATFALLSWLHRYGHAPGEHSHDHAHGHEHAHGHGHGHGPASEHAPQTGQGDLSLYDGRMAVAGLALHSLLDGVAVSAALANQRGLGLFVAFFVLLHKLPEGATAAALTYASGGNKAAARRGVFVVAAASLAGAASIFVIGPVLSYALALTAGVTTSVGVGIAQHLLKHRPKHTALGVSAGALLFAAAEWLLHG